MVEEMEDLTPARSIEIGQSLQLLISAMNEITEEELKNLIRIAHHKEAMDPFIDPTKYRIEANSIHLGKKFVTELLQFKRAVKGIGNCK